MVRFINFTKDEFLSNYKKLYRFISIERFIEIFEENQLTFINPVKWEDPYEKAFLTAKYFVKGKRIDLPITDNLYCLCWTKTASSEAFWKGYTPNNDGIRMTIWSERLLEHLTNLEEFNIYIGKVEYLRTDKFREIKSKKNKNYILSLSRPHVGTQHIQLVLKKRLAFQYENEIRIILVPKIGYDHTDKNYCKIDLDPGNIFIEYMLHPKIGKHTTALLKEFFSSKYNITVKKSNLYDETHWKISIP